MEDLKQRVEEELTLEVGEVYETNEHDTVKVIYLLEGQPVVLSWIATAPEACWGKPHFIQKSHIIRRVSKSKQAPQELTEQEEKLIEANKELMEYKRHFENRLSEGILLSNDEYKAMLGIANKGEV